MNPADVLLLLLVGAVTMLAVIAYKTIKDRRGWRDELDSWRDPETTGDIFHISSSNSQKEGDERS